MLERNIVYCLSHATKGEDYSQIVDKFSSVSFDEKVRKLKKLIKEKKMEKTFSEWFESVDSIRSMRNKIVHGQWETNWPLEDSISFHIPAPRRETGRMKLDEFLSNFEYLKRVTESFQPLRDPSASKNRKQRHAGVGSASRGME